MLNPILTWGGQTVIVALAIWMFLRFVRLTRGSRLIRGLFLTVVFGIAGIWTMARVLELEALLYLVKAAIPFVLISFAIVFQPELRRAMAQLGERSLVGRLMSPSREDTLDRIVRAARAMAHRRHGALIAFEREGSLNTYIESGTQIDARVTARLVESLFNPAGPLHDGAVIVRADRLAAAGCFFPLPQEADLDASLGTRHRSAVGISEETDAVVLVVSEETGRISIAREGTLSTRIPDDELESTLRAILENEDAGADSRRLLNFSFGREEVFNVGASVLLAIGLMFFAFQNLTVKKFVLMSVTGVPPSQKRAPRPNEILVVLPSEDEFLLTPESHERFDIALSGPRAEIERVEKNVSGVYEIDEVDWNGGKLPLDEVDWGDDAWMIGITTEWKNGVGPALAPLHVDTATIDLDPASIAILEEDIDARYVVDLESISFEGSSTVTVRGPKEDVEDLEKLARRLEFEPVRLSPDHVGHRSYALRLTASTLAQGLELTDDEPPSLGIEVVPDVRVIGVVNADISMVSFDPSRLDELADWDLPPNQTSIRLTLQTRGLFDADADLGTPAMQELKRAILQAVEENLNVYVDLAELPPEGGGSTLPIRTSWRTDVPSILKSLELEVPRTGSREALEVLFGADASVLLSPKTP